MPATIARKPKSAAPAPICAAELTNDQLLGEIARRLGSLAIAGEDLFEILCTTGTKNVVQGVPDKTLRGEVDTRLEDPDFAAEFTLSSTVHSAVFGALDDENVQALAEDRGFLVVGQGASVVDDEVGELTRRVANDWSVFGDLARIKPELDRLGTLVRYDLGTKLARE